MQKIVPFLWFDGKAEEAMNFYVSIFKNSKVLKVTRYGVAGPDPNGRCCGATLPSHAPPPPRRPADCFFPRSPTSDGVSQVTNSGIAGVNLNCGPPFRA